MVSHAIRMIPRLDRPTRTRLLSGSFERAVADEDGQTLYLTSQDNLVAAISLETMNELWRREVPGSPRGIDISSDQSTLAVALSEADAVVLLDAAGGGSARRSIALGNGFSAQAVSYVADGSILIAGDTVLPIVRVSSEGAILDRSYGLHRYSPPWDSFRSHDYSRVFFRGGGFCGTPQVTAWLSAPGTPCTARDRLFHWTENASSAVLTSTTGISGPPASWRSPD